MAGVVLGPYMNPQEIKEKLSEIPSDNLVEYGLLTKRETAKVMSKMQVFLYPVLEKEPFGLSVAEAMSYGCYTIVSDVRAGYHEIVRNKQNSIVVPAGNSKELANEICHALECKNLEDISQNARETISKQLNWTIAIERILKSFD